MIKLLIEAFFHTILRFTLIVLLSGIGLVCFIGETSPGLKLFIDFVAPMLPGHLTVGETEGALFSRFTLRQVSYEYQNTTMTADIVKLHWSLSALQQHHLMIHQLTLDKVHINAPITPTEDKQHTAPALGLLDRVTADHLDIHDLSVTHGDHPTWHIATLNLQKTTANTITFQLNTLDGELSGKAECYWAPALTWSVTLAGKHLNPGEYWTAWPGDLNFHLNTTGQLPTTGTPVMTATLRTDPSTLRRAPVQSTLALQWSDQVLQIQQARIVIGDTQANVSGSLATNWNILWDLSIPRLATILPNAQGSLLSHGHLTGTRTAPHLETTIEANQIVMAKHRLKHLSLAFSGQVTSLNNHWITHATVAIANQRYLRLQVSLPTSFDWKNYTTQPLTASVNVDFPNLSTLSEAIPDITQLQGVLQGTLQMQGSLSQPVINGTIKLTNGHLTLPKLNITLRNITLDATGNQSRRLAYSGRFQSGEGSGTLKGTTDFSQATLPTEITVTGSNLQALNLPEYKLSVSPTLNLHLTNSSLLIDGDIRILHGEINHQDYRQMITLSDDVEFVGAKKKMSIALLTAMPTMRVAVHIDNPIPLHYQDLKTAVSGNLTINTSPTSLATATGELYANGGTYHAYGQNLEITEGRLVYTGGFINNPGLNIKAIRKINTVISGNAGSFTTLQHYGGTQVLTVGVHLLGTLDKPVFALFADPAGLSQDDILSYLLLGIPRTQASIQDSTSILNASAALNLTGGAPQSLLAITDKLQTGLGLSELNIAPVQTFDPNANKHNGGVVGATSLVLGKKIANNLYVHYSVSLFSATPITILNVRYQFSKHWSVQSETSTIDNGADILYSLESN